MRYDDDVYDDEADDDDAHDLLYELCGLGPDDDRYPDYVPYEYEPGMQALLLAFCLDNRCSRAMAEHALLLRHRARIVYRELDALGYVDDAAHELERMRASYAPRPAPASAQPERRGFISQLRHIFAV